MGVTQEKLAQAGVDTLGIVASPPERARMYFGVRPTRLRLAADGTAATHRAYGIPHEDLTKDTLPAVLEQAAEHYHETLAPDVPKEQAIEHLAKQDGIELTQADMDAVLNAGRHATGQFLIDGQGVIRWTNIEGRDMAVGAFPSDDQLLAAAQSVTA